LANYQDGNQDNKLGIIISPQGRITSIRINNQPQPENVLVIPEHFLPLVHACFKKALEISSSYEAPYPIEVKIVRRGLKEIPQFHLNRLAKLIVEKTTQKEGQKDPKIRVKFVNNDLTLQVGRDFGGLSRGYFDEVFDGLIKCKNLIFQKISSSEVVPCTQKDYQNRAPLPELNRDEYLTYQSVGQLMMYCYHSESNSVVSNDSCSIGRHFDEALFKAALCLSAKEIDTSFNDLSFQTKLKMCQALIDAYGEQATYQDRMQLLSKETLSSEELEKGAQQAFYADSLPQEFTTDEGPNRQAILQDPTHQKIIKQALIDAVLSSESSQGKLGRQLAPIHAIAQGMKSICFPGEAHTATEINQRWDAKISPLNYHQFSTKVQGSIDRQQVIDHIKLGPYIPKGPEQEEIEKKVGWLKEWLADTQNGATEEEIRKLVKFFTDSTSLPQGQKITIHSQHSSKYTLIPSAHTCTFEVEFASCPMGDASSFNDFTKDAFIKMIKELVLTDPTNYSMN
jgi:hypothetical protein